MELNNLPKRRRSVTLYEYPTDLEKNSDKNIIFSSKKSKKIETHGEGSDDEGIDFSKLFKRQSTEDNSYVVDNNIYFNDDITMESINKLNKQLRALQTKLIGMSNNLSIECPPIRLHITSNGGSVFAAFRCINCIKALTIPVHTIVDGYAASAATLISVCGQVRYINKYSNMLIHELRSATSWNKMSELEDEVENMKKIMDQIKDIYVEHTNLSRAELNKLLKKDMDWDPKKCLAAGLVDEIIE
jgi:ATP-dependent protease ClpP protease subunit